MHELSIAMSIVESAEEAARQSGCRTISRIDLEIGTLAGVEPDALDFAWPSAIKDTMLQHAERHINYIQARAQCMDCGTTFDTPARMSPCPSCGERFTFLLRGEELRIVSLMAK